MIHNILITGISGFVGSHLAQYLKERGGVNIVGIVRDSLPSMWLDEILDGVTLVQGDIRDFGLLKRVVGHYNIDQIYHLAAAAQVKEAWKDSLNVFGSNVMGTVNLLEAVRQINGSGRSGGSGIGGCKVLVFNTDKCYGEKIGATEEDRYEASETYATSKVCQGMVGLSFRKTYGMNIKISHCCNIYGYDPFNSRLVSNTIKNCIRGIMPEIWINDRSIREYIFIDDVLDAVWKIMNYEDNLEKNIYNIRTGYIFNQKEVVEKILEYFPDSEAKYIDKNIQYQIQEQSMISVNWDWKPRYEFSDGIKKTIDLFYEYEEDWNKR